MAKKSKSSKKSRFGNPGKAAADAAARNHTTSATDMRLERAMSSLAPGFALWLESRGWPTTAVDNSLMILDDFFDLYRGLEPQLDPTALEPDVVAELMDAAAVTSRVAVMALGAGARDYVDYLAAAGLWTGTSEDLTAIRQELSRVTRPLTEADDEFNNFDGEFDAERFADYFEGDSGDDLLTAEDEDLPDIWIPEMSHSEVVETVATSPLWQNSLALRDWIGEGRELNEHGTLIDQTGAAAVLIHSGLGALGAAAKFTTPQDHDAMRLSLYWDLLEANGLITVKDGQVTTTEQPDPLTAETEMLLAARDLMAHFIFLCILDAAVDGILDAGQLEMAGWLAMCASENPPESALFIEALETPETVHPDVLSIAQNMAYWADEGLISVGELIEVPPAWRPDVLDILKDDFVVKAIGPGAATDAWAMPQQD